MHFYSFDSRDPVFEIGQWQLSFQVITLENVYGLNPNQTNVHLDGECWYLDCKQLSWAGQQQHASGSVQVNGQCSDSGCLCVCIQATASHKIRAVKILVRNLSSLTVLDMLDNAHPLPADGLIERYPNKLRLPLLFLLKPDGSRIGLRCEDPHARAKRFAVHQETMGPFAGTHTIECIHEEDARWFDTQIEVPTWIIASGVDIAAFRNEQLAFNEKCLGFVPWEDRSDVPDWVRDIRLCLTIHGMHWSGYLFNSYDQMLEIIRFVADRIEGRHVLAYLPGWEGRYYWQYGDYRPDPMLGGEAGFAQLCDEAKVLGVHIMPMFGGNCANAWNANFHAFGPSSYMKSATRNVFHGNQPDWDMSRGHDTGWQAWLNPGAPAWQKELSRQILRLVDQFGFEAVFLDTIEVWINDPDFNVREGLYQLNQALREDRPELLVAGEDWWDGLLGIFPIFQQTGKWRQVPAWVSRYARLIGHICDGEASRGSTGVFESGYAAYERLPNEAPYIPTLAFVDGTLDRAKSEIEALIDVAKELN